MKASESAREAAASLTVIPEMRELIRSGRYDDSVYVQLITQAEARGRIAGIREAAASIADGQRMSGNDQWSVGYDAAARRIADAIRSMPVS